jgi:hypothetical protein
MIFSPRSRYQIVPIGSQHTGFALRIDGVIACWAIWKAAAVPIATKMPQALRCSKISEICIQ